MLLTDPAAGVWVVVTPDVAFGCTPRTLLVTANATVQFPLAGIVIPVNDSAVAPAVKLAGVVPTHVPPTAPPTALMLTRVSVNAAPVSAMEFGFVNVSVTVELPPDWIDVGENALAIVGGEATIVCTVEESLPGTVSRDVVETVAVFESGFAPE